MSYARREGWLWPAEDTECFPACMRQVKDIQRVLEHVEGRHSCIQAGGNCGVFPAELAKHFESVYTCEPDPVNFRCLVNNVEAQNVYAFNCALGFERKRVDMERTDGNAGAGYVHGKGCIPTLRIDDLGIDDCDLIYLDVEGAELEALFGAEKTMESKPVICLEHKHLSERYGHSNAVIENWLSQHGYRQVDKVGNDSIFRC